MNFRITQLDEVQGKYEAHSKAYDLVRCASTGEFDPIIRQSQTSVQLAGGFSE